MNSVTTGFEQAAGVVVYGVGVVVDEIVVVVVGSGGALQSFVPHTPVLTSFEPPS